MNYKRHEDVECQLLVLQIAQKASRQVVHPLAVADLWKNESNGLEDIK